MAKRLKLKEEMPMFRHDDKDGVPIWFSEGTIFEIVSEQKPRHEDRNWYIIKHAYFTKPLAGLHNPDNFELTDTPCRWCEGTGIDVQNADSDEPQCECCGGSGVK